MTIETRHPGARCGESRSLRSRSPLVALVLLALGLAALLAPAASAAPAAGSTLVYQLSTKLAGIDPLFASGPEAAVVVDALFDGLTSWDAQTSAVLPAVASSWDASANVTVWTFHLRADAKFSNGTPVTAQDFKFAWERLLTGANRDWGSYMLSNVKGTAALAAGKAKHLSGVVAQNRTTLVVKLTAPYADFPSTVANPSLAPVPSSLLSTAKKSRQFRSAPVGNGPFLLAEPWNRKDTVRLAADPGYNGTKPHIAGITFTVIEDPAAAYAQFQAGTLDVANFPSDSLAEVEAACGTSADGFTASPGHQVVPGPIAGAMWSVFNTKKAPLNDVRVRRAISLALDRTRLAATQPIPGIFLTPATGVLSPGMPGYAPGQWLYAQLDLAQAAALLAEAGFPGGAGLPEITFLTTNKAGKSEYATDLAAIGVKVTFTQVSQAQFLTRWDSGDYMMMQDGWNWYPTAADVLYNGFYGPLDGSLSLYDDPAVNASLRRACATLDDAARLAALQSIDATIAAAVPVTPIAYFNRTVVCSARLREAVLSQMNVFDFTRVWIEQPAGARSAGPTSPTRRGVPRRDL